MTRPRLDDRDPQPEREWQPTSHEYRRREALQATAEAVMKARENRMKPKTEETTP